MGFLGSHMFYFIHIPWKMDKTVYGRIIHFGWAYNFIDILHYNYRPGIEN